MKMIHLEVEDDSYQAIINFIKQLPENSCHIVKQEELKAEQQHIEHCLELIKQGDYSDFDDFDSIKNQL